MTDIDTTWAELTTIAHALDAMLDPHGLIHVDADGDGRYVLVDRDVEFRVGLYEADHDLALVMIEVPTAVEAVDVARVLSSHWIEVQR